MKPGRSFSKSSAALLVTVSVMAFAQPACAEILDLVCAYEIPGNPPSDFHLSVDLVNQRVNQVPATISDTLIEWDNAYGPPSQRSDHLSIDRTTGNLVSTQYSNGVPFATVGGKCRRAVQKF